MNNPLYINSNLQSHFLNSVQGLNIPVQNFKNEILNRINNLPFFKIIFEPRKCCDNFLYIAFMHYIQLMIIIYQMKTKIFYLKKFLK